jgi:hypothetical protein
MSSQIEFGNAKKIHDTFRTGQTSEKQFLKGIKKSTQKKEEEQLIVKSISDASIAKSKSMIKKKHS